MATVTATRNLSRTALPPPPPPPTGSPEAINAVATDVRQQVASSGNAGSIGEGGFRAELSIGGNIDKLIEKNLGDRLAGKNPKFSDEIMAMQKEKLFRESQGATKRGRMAIMADSARRGVFRSEATGTLIRDVEVAGMQQYSSGVKDLMIEKARADHEDMIQAINQSQQWLQGLRQYSLGLEQNAIAREQIKATLAAAAMQAAASRYAADQGLAGARAAAGAARYSANMQYESSRAYNAQTGGYMADSGGRPISIQQAQAAGLYG